LAIDLDFTTVGWLHSSQDLHEGALASPVFADYRQDLTAIECETNLAQGPNPWK
jgi:hypothetical protein